MVDGQTKQKVNLKQISERLGVSLATVSNALNHKRGVNTETAAAVFRVAKELGYIKEDTISKIKFVIFRKNGLILEDTPFFSLVFEGIEKESRALGYEVALSHINQEEPDCLAQIRWLLNDSSSALIVLGTELTDKDIKQFTSAKCPVLTLDYWCGDMSFNGVLINNTDSARLAVSYLISKGHNKIGYLRGSFRIKAFHARAQGYRLAMQAAELDVNPDHIVTVQTSINGAYEDMLAHIGSGAPLPTAFFADNDMIALGVMKALQQCGYRIPEDVSIIGFDDISYSEISNPPLTTIRVPKQEMGQLAVRRVVEMMRDDNRIRTKIQVCTSFIERESVCDIKKKGANRDAKDKG